MSKKSSMQHLDTTETGRLYEQNKLQSMKVYRQEKGEMKLELRSR
jgi:hypothetical protein